MAAFTDGLARTQFATIGVTTDSHSQTDPLSQPTPPIDFVPSPKATELDKHLCQKLRRVTKGLLSFSEKEEERATLSEQQIRWSPILHSAGEKNLAHIYRKAKAPCCVLFSVAKKTEMNMSTFPSAIAASVMQFTGSTLALASVNRHWKHIVHSLISPFIPRIIDHVDWLKELFKAKLNADANFLLEDLVMQTIREIKGNFALKKEDILKRMNNKLCRLLKRKNQYVRSHYYEKLIDQPRVMKLLIKSEPELLAIAPLCVREEEEFVKEIVQISGLCLRHASDKLRANSVVGLLAVQQNPDAYEFTLGEARESTLKEALRGNGGMLRHAPTKARQSLEYLNLAISSNCPSPMGRGLAILQYSLVENAWENRKILELILLHNRGGETVMNHDLLPQELWEDRDFNLQAALHNPEIELQHTPFSDDFEFHKAVFMKTPSFFWNLVINDSQEMISETMKKRLLADRELVLKLLKEKAQFSLHHEALLKPWKADSEIIEAATLHLSNPLASPTYDGIALKEADPSLFNNIPFIERIVSNVGVALQYIPLSFRLKYSAKIFELALTNCGASIAWVPREILDANPKFYLLALKTFGLLWRSLSPTEQLNLTYARIAIKADFKVFEFFPPAFQAMDEFVEIAVKEDASMIKFASSDWREDPWKFELVLSWNGLALEYTLPAFKSHYHFNKVAILENCEAYEFIFELYKTRRGILLSADLNSSNSCSAHYYHLTLGYHLKRQGRDS